MNRRKLRRGKRKRTRKNQTEEKEQRIFHISKNSAMAGTTSQGKQLHATASSVPTFHIPPHFPLIPVMILDLPRLNSLLNHALSQEPILPDYIQQLMGMERSSSKRLMESLMQESQIPRNPSQSLGPAIGERVERGADQDVVSSKL